MASTGVEGALVASAGIDALPLRARSILARCFSFSFSRARTTASMRFEAVFASATREGSPSWIVFEVLGCEPGFADGAKEMGLTSRVLFAPNLRGFVHPGPWVLSPGGSIGNLATSILGSLLSTTHSVLGQMPKE
ncbi:hypothetical protein AG1IA_06154 [Rhizoctonia solani AG-1 IA]|uniref:Uncharacterized protein n=1 Tax=Thanatephorus cucumeris (strain AG1-IA) TaxID=983506 RepID=L8WNV0_THACA|nr:hypothetical protein AG1IA_06154 [Rhizoctonia solani AG-1 IA]